MFLPLRRNAALLLLLFSAAILIPACSSGSGGNTNPPEPSIQNFSASSTSGTAPLTTTFSWSVSGDGDGCRLDVDGNGSAEYSFGDCRATTSQTHTYETPGSYEAVLSLNDGGSERISITVSEEDAPPLVEGLNGQTLGPDGEPLEGATLRVYTPEGLEVARGQSDERGYYRLELDEGRYNLFANKGDIGSAVLGLNVNPGEEVRFDLSLQALGAIEGRAVLAGAEDSSGVTVSISGSPYTARTAANGSFRLLVPKGTYELVAQQTGYRRVRVESVEVRPDETTQLGTLELVEALEPEIEAFDADPASGAAPLSTTFSWSVAGPAGVTLACSLDTDGNGAANYQFLDCRETTSQRHSYTNPGNYEAVLTLANGESESVTVTVNEPEPQPTAPNITSFTATPDTVEPGESVRLEWNVTGSEPVTFTISPDIGTVPDTSFEVRPTRTTTYTLTASNAAGKDSATVTVTVVQPEAPTILSFTATPNTIDEGGSTTLTWEVTGDEPLTLTLEPGNRDVSGGESLEVSPTQTTTYTLTASNAAGEDTAQTTVAVEEPAGPITVTSPAGDRGGPSCKLRDAIIAANTDTAVGGCPAGDGADTIILQADTYTLTEVDNTAEGPNGLPAITSEITILGNGAVIERSAAASTPAFRLLHIASSGNLYVEDLTLQNGGGAGLVGAAAFTDANGAGVLNQGTMEAARVSILNNNPGDDVRVLGIGLYNSGTLTLEGSTVAGNFQPRYGAGAGTVQGAGIYNTGSLTVVDSTVSDNRLYLDEANGGGIYNGGTLLLKGSTLLRNGTDANFGGEGSGLYNAADAVAEVEATTFDANGFDVAGGAGAANYGELTVKTSTFTNNYTTTRGGGLLNHGTATVTSTIFSGNTGYGSGSAFYNARDMVVEDSTIRESDGENGGTVENAIGGKLEIRRTVITDNSTSEGGGVGGIENHGILTLEESIVSQNFGDLNTTGGIENRGIATIIRTTISDNITSNPPGSSTRTGNGVWNSGSLVLANSTVSGNQGDGSGVYNIGTAEISYSTVARNGNFEILNDGGEIVLRASIISDPSGDAPNCSGVVLTRGYNLSSDTSCSLSRTTDLVNPDPKLGPLEDNGGFAPTHALLPGSVAIDHIPASECSVETDQRGVARPQRDACDIGAFELKTN